MRIFNEEKKTNPESMLMLNKKESKDIIDALKFASDNNKRKLNWKKLYNKLYEQLAVF